MDVLKGVGRILVVWEKDDMYCTYFLASKHIVVKGLAAYALMIEYSQ